MSIFSLSEDILYAIFTELELDSKTLVAVAQVCRRFHEASRSLIFRRIPDLTAKKRQMLRRTLSETPKLRNYIQCWLPLGLNCDGTIPDNELEEALALPGLRQFSMRRTSGLPKQKRHFFLPDQRFFNQGRDEEDDLQLPFLDEKDTRWNNIRSVRLDSASAFYFSSTEIARFMLLPNIRSLKANGLCQLRMPKLPAEFRQRKSGLTELELRGAMSWSCKTSVIHELLLLCPDLKNLSLHIPIATNCYWTPGMIIYAICDVEEPVPCASLAAMLEPVREKLEHLTLFQEKDDTHYDGSILNLSEFLHLKHLEIPASCIGGDGKMPDCQHTVYERLPPSLQRLYLTFPADSGILYNNSEQDKMQDVSVDEIPAERYQWLHQFAIHKATFFPHLSNLSMQDPIANTQKGHWLPRPWVVPSDLNRLFQHDQIDVNLHISYPHPGSPIHRHAWSGCTGRNTVEITEQTCTRTGCEGLSDAKEGREPYDEWLVRMVMNEDWEEYDKQEALKETAQETMDRDRDTEGSNVLEKS